MNKFNCGVEKLVSHESHKLGFVGSSPAAATKEKKEINFKEEGV
jgi:hypothetical protein